MYVCVYIYIYIYIYNVRILKFNSCKLLNLNKQSPLLVKMLLHIIDPIFLINNL